MRLTFLHTADLQIGLTASSAGKLAKQLQEARVESLRTVLRLASEKHVDFVLIAGDMFETNQVSKKYVQQVAAVLEQCRPLRVFILPGNHDYFGPNSVYQSEEFTRLSQHVTVFRERKPLVVADLDLTFYPAPCFETRSNESPTTGIAKQSGTRYHVAVLHGSIPSVFGRTTEEDDSFPMTVDELKNLGMDCIALGHWHSLYPDPGNDPGSPFFYAGTPEPTAFGERASGQVLLVELDDSGRKVTAIPTSQYRFVDLQKDIRDAMDVESLRKELYDLSQPEKTLVRLKLKGVISIATREALDTLRNELETRLAYSRFDDRELLLEPDESDLNQFTRGGIASTTFSLLEKRREEAPAAERAKYERAVALAYKAFKGTLE